MSVKEEVKTLLAREAFTMTKLAVEMTKISGRKYTMKSISDKLARKTLKYEEFILILNILKYKIELKKIEK
ncbi:putative uncharacterized protein [Fusobacterium sp. CAG:439]|nr:putative uncharacterized protein [Fusobacterium sp. CAG:439]HIT93399.1 LLM class flavin-dependent oxidoreductase [Candidatus Stercorousia faecigallinarum]